MKAYSIQLGELPSPLTEKGREELNKIIKFLKEECDGFIAISPQVLDGRPITFVVFDTINNCKGARNLFKLEGNDVGTYIMNVEISDDMQTLNIGEPVLD